MKTYGDFLALVERPFTFCIELTLLEVLNSSCLIHIIYISINYFKKITGAATIRSSGRGSSSSTAMFRTNTITITNRTKTSRGMFIVLLQNEQNIRINRSAEAPL